MPQNIETIDGTSEDKNYDGPEPKRASYLDVWHEGELITQKKVQLVVAPPSPSSCSQLAADLSLNEFVRSARPMDAWLPTKLSRKVYASGMVLR